MQYKNKICIAWSVVTLLWVVPFILTAETTRHITVLTALATVLILLKFKITRKW